MSHPPKLFERTNEHGVKRGEIERLVDDVDAYLYETCGEGRARKITVEIKLEMKGERNA